MYLRASDKVTGVKNFHSAIGSPLIRRATVQKALRQGLAPGKGLEAAVFNYQPPEKPLAVGLLGAGQQGQRLLKAATAKYIAVKSIADLRPSNQKLAAAAVRGAKGYDSYEKLLAAAKEDGLEAVIVALPSDLHAAAALAALDMGLHVFIEPPMALTVADAKKIVLRAEEKKLCVAIGQQRRYNWIYDHALEMVRKDLLDQVHYVRAQWHLLKPEKQEHALTKDAKAEQAKKPAIDFWPELAKEERGLKFPGYESPEELVHWRLYEQRSGGLLAELGSQLFDAAATFVAASPNRDPQRPYPLSVAGSASQVLPSGEGDIDDHVHCIVEYAIQGYVDAPEIPLKARKKIALQFDMIIGSDFDAYGETVLGRRGSLVLESEQKPMLFYMADVDKPLRVLEKKDTKGTPELSVPKDGKGDEESAALGQVALAGADAGSAAELEHWAYCCKPAAGSKGDTKPRCDARAGLYTTVVTVAAGKAIRQGTRVDFQDAWFDAKSEKTPDAIV